jgi:ribosomal protein L24
MAKKKEPKFKVGDWVRFIGGPDKGRTTTITEVFPNCNGFYYSGFYCGRVVGGNESDTEQY